MNAELNTSSNIEFTLAGKACSLSREELVSALSGELPADIHEYWVEIDGQEWPVKQVISLATGLANTEFGSTHAQSLLKKLGFEVKSSVNRSPAKLATKGEHGVDEQSARHQGGQNPPVDVATLIRELRDKSRRVSADEFLASSATTIDLPGIYAWWVDSVGAAELSRGFHPDEKIGPGLLYAGLAGATRANGKRSQNTLRKRIVKMHLGNRHTFSTLRWSEPHRVDAETSSGCGSPVCGCRHFGPD